MTKQKTSQLAYFLISCLAVLAIHYLYYLFADEQTECFTNSICLSSKNDIYAFSAIQGGFIIFLILLATFSIRFMWFAVQKGFAIYLGGGLMLMLGPVGIAILIAVTPQDEILNFIHIIIIGSLLSLLGGFMIFKTWTKK